MNSPSMNSSTISQSNSSIMEYLIQKLESRSRRISKQKSIFTQFSSFEAVYAQKKELFALFSDLEDDLKQASYAIKALLAENKALSIQSGKNDEMAKKIIYELTQNNNYLVAENENLRMQLNNITSPIEDTINNNCDVNDLCNTNVNLINKQLTNITEENEMIDITTNNQMPNVKNIMNNMKKNKTKLKETIKQHFNKNNKPNQSHSAEKKERKVVSARTKPVQEQIIDVPENENETYNSKSNEILIKIMKSSDSIALLNEKLGNNFMEKILNNDEEFIKKAEEILEENEQLKVPMRIRNSLMKSKSKDNKKMKRSLSSSFTSSRCNIIKEGTAFEKSLRDYPITSKINQKKKFVHYTNPYGNYFTNPNESNSNTNTFANAKPCGHNRSHGNIKPISPNNSTL